MIKSIRPQGRAAFGADQSLRDLGPVNFVFGPNATGKTTLSRIVADKSSHGNNVDWDGGRTLTTMVYNRDFVDRNFGASSELPGIFTLGVESKELRQQIESATMERQRIVDDIANLRKSLDGNDGVGGKRRELEELDTRFVDSCWSLKKKHDRVFAEAFKGVRDKKVAFRDRLIQEATRNTAALLTYAELERQARTVFAPSPSEEPEIPSLSTERVARLEEAPILSKSVVGASDVGIAPLIRRLENSDWVQQGIVHYEHADGLCPFCQQLAPTTLAESLAKYFDRGFEQAITQLKQLLGDYSSIAESLTAKLREIAASESTLLDRSALASEIDTLVRRLELNLGRIQAKLAEPSRPMSFESTADALQAIKTRIDETNSRVRSHNETVRNLKQVRSELIDRCWKWIVSDEAAGILADYRKQRDAISKGVAGLEDKIRSLTSTLRTNEQELAELEAQTTSVEPTVREINEILLAFGFRSFRLSKAERPDFYKLVRPDGTDAAETLSDGERSFVTFLYFYHLLEGSLTASGVTDDRIVVFDDPVSSLDSDVLFIVSTLIKEILSAIRQGIGPIRQAFVLTHNVYFHREVTFRPRGTKGPQDRFWTLRKTNDVTTVRRHDVNPIKTGYEMLWVQVRAAGSTDPTIQNTLRRILESYFTLLGNVDSDEICAQFEGADKVVCKSLFSWVNSGSHAVHGDEYATMDGTSVSVYLDVFREVFVKTQHLGHYEMMMEAARPPVAE